MITSTEKMAPVECSIHKIKFMTSCPKCALNADQPSQDGAPTDRDAILKHAKEAGFGVLSGFIMPTHAGHITEELERFALLWQARAQAVPSHIIKDLEYLIESKGAVPIGLLMQIKSLLDAGPSSTIGKSGVVNP